MFRVDYLSVDASLTIKDSAGNGKLIHPNSSYVFLVYVGGALYLESGTLEFTNSETDGIDVFRGPFIMKGGTINSAGYSIWRDSSPVTISGGTINGGFYGSDGDLTITGGKFSFDPTEHLDTTRCTAEKDGEYWNVLEYISDATVNLADDFTVISLTIGDKTITDLSGFDVIYAKTDSDITSETVPTKKGTYVAYVTAKDTNKEYKGTAKSAVFTQKNDISGAAVALNADNTVASITIGDETITDLTDFDITYGTDNSHTATTPPTIIGSYFAYVTAKDTNKDYRGTAKSAEFAVTKSTVKTADEFKAAVNKGGEVQLDADIILPLSESLTFEKNMTLDLNGHTLTVEKAGRVMLIGAGAAGQLILRDIATSKETNDKVYCIIDDNSNKWGRQIDGVTIVGGREKILDSVKKYDINKIYIAIPTLTAHERKDLLDICKDTGCELKNLPGMYQLVNGEVSVSTMRNVDIVDLLGREPIKVDMNEIFDSIKNKVILVTGGGGSIGSELCRQIASHNPKKLIIFDIYENNAYDIEQELRTDYPSLDLEVLIGSVRDYNRLDEIFDKFRPNLVYHAAAHKHVPLMEDSPKEAIKNNVFGTYNACYVSLKYNVEKFVLISTDKAVNPTNVMGASKRICEMITQVFDKMILNNQIQSIPNFVNTNDKIDEKNKTCFVAVRFGNVLGSNGSVIPKFKKQIENGGPVTVTHPDIIRYFMTIKEAVSLVLQAGVYAKDGEIFVFDMGTPVKIDTLARNLIKLSGYKPDVDIKIEYTGLRPGEKLYEEKLMEEEGLTKTRNELIHIGAPIDIDEKVFIKKLKELYDNLNVESNDEEIVKLVEDITPTFKPVGRKGQTDLTDTYYKQLKDAS